MARIFTAGLVAWLATAGVSQAACCQAPPPESPQERYEREIREKEQERQMTIGLCIGIGVLAVFMGLQFARDTKFAIDAHQSRDNWE